MTRSLALRAFACALAILFAATASAHAQGTAKPKSTLNSEVSQQFPDNVTGAITPGSARTVTSDIIASTQSYAGVNPQAGTSYTIQTSDYGQLVTFNNANPVAVTIPGASTAGFAPFSLYLQNRGAGTVTVTPSIGTIDGNATLTLAQNEGSFVVSDGTNWQLFKPKVVATVNLNGGVTGTLPVANGGIGSGTPGGAVLDTITGWTSTGFIERTGAATYNFVADPLPVANGGTASSAATGTALDNITGFASTGFLKRTGAGAYSFIADPVPVANGGTGGSSASGTLVDNISGFASTGFIKRTGAGAYGFVADPVPVANGGTNCAAASGTCLDNIANFSLTGVISRTGAGTYAFRTITGTANEITATNGDGIAGNPTLSLPTALTFTGKTVTGGTFASPTLSGTVAGTNTVPLSVLAQAGANTMVGNWTSGTANELANAMPSCSATGNVLQYTTNTGVTCSISPTGMLVVTATGVNFNSANSDTSISIPLPSGYSRYAINAIFISGASASITTATCGVFTASGAGGTAIVTSGSAITVNTASENTNNNIQSLSVNNLVTESYTASPLFFRVQNAQGSAATGTVSIYYRPLS